MADIDWSAIKTEYITGTISLRKLANKHGVSTSMVMSRSAAEKWVEQRERYQRSVVAKTIEKTANKEANKLAKLMSATDKAIDVVVKAFDDEQQFNRYIVERMEEYAEPETYIDDNDVVHSVGMRKYSEEKTFAKVDTKALKDLTMVLKDLTGLMRNLYGIPTQAEAESQRIAAERLKLEQKKADAADSSVTGIEVVFAAGPEEWNE